MIYKDYYIEETPSGCNIYADYDAWRTSSSPMFATSSMAEAKEWVDAQRGLAGEEIERIPITEEFEEFIRSLPFMPERGKPLPDYVYQTMAPEFVTSVMSAPVSGYGRELADRVALDVTLFLKGGNFEIVKKLDETGWSSEDIAYNARIRHKPTYTEWDVEVWAPFDWRKPETYKDGFVVFLPAGERISEERWEIMPEEEWETEEFDLTFKGGEEASRIIEGFIRGRQ